MFDNFDLKLLNAMQEDADMAEIPVIVVSPRLCHAKSSITLDVCDHQHVSVQEKAAQNIDELTAPVECYQLHQEMVNR